MNARLELVGQPVFALHQLCASPKPCGITV
jgi:hypothetical protein